MKHCVSLLSLFVALAVSFNADASVVLAPNDTYAGRSYADWEARWWQAALSIPVVGGDHPLISGGPFAEDSGVQFLAAAFCTNSYEVNISEGTALFLPIINVECSVPEADPFHGDDEASLRACANGHIDHTSGIFAEVDGEGIDVANFRFESALFQWGPLPTDNVYGLPAGATSDAVDAGYYLLVKPLSVGRYTIRTRGTFDDFGLTGDATFNINVGAVPEPGSLFIFGIGALTLAGYGRRRRSGNSAHVNS